MPWRSWRQAKSPWSLLLRSVIFCQSGKITSSKPQTGMSIPTTSPGSATLMWYRHVILWWCWSVTCETNTQMWSVAFIWLDLMLVEISWAGMASGWETTTTTLMVTCKDICLHIMIRSNQAWSQCTRFCLAPSQAGEHLAHPVWCRLGESKSEGLSSTKHWIPAPSRVPIRIW